MSTQLALDAAPSVEEHFLSKDEWLAARRSGIGASEPAAVIGASPFLSPLELYAQKVGALEPDPQETEAMEWGLLLEPVLSAKYEQVTGRRLAAPAPWTLRRSVGRPWMLASLDRQIVGDPQGPGVLQLKTASAFRAEDWQDEPPLAYQVQVQWEMAVLGVAWGSLAVLIGGQRFRTYDLLRNDRFLGLLIARAEAFWGRVQRRDAPPAVAEDKAAIAALYATATPGLTVNLPGEAVEWAEEEREAREQLAHWTKRKDAAQTKIKAAIGEAEAGVLPNGTVYTWKNIAVKGYTVEPRTDRRLTRKEPK